MRVVHENQGIGQHTADHVEIVDAAPLHLPVEPVPGEMFLGQRRHQVVGAVGAVLAQDQVDFLAVGVHRVVGHQVEHRFERQPARDAAAIEIAVFLPEKVVGVERIEIQATPGAIDEFPQHPEIPKLPLVEVRHRQARSADLDVRRGCPNRIHRLEMPLLKLRAAGKRPVRFVDRLIKRRSIEIGIVVLEQRRGQLRGGIQVGRGALGLLVLFLVCPGFLGCPDPHELGKPVVKPVRGDFETTIQVLLESPAGLDRRRPPSQVVQVRITGPVGVFTH